MDESFHHKPRGLVQIWKLIANCSLDWIRISGQSLMTSQMTRNGQSHQSSFFSSINPIVYKLHITRKDDIEFVHNIHTQYAWYTSVNMHIVYKLHITILQLWRVPCSSPSPRSFRSKVLSRPRDAWWIPQKDGFRNGYMVSKESNNYIIIYNNVLYMFVAW